MKINIEIEFSDEEIIKYLEYKGYVIEEHELTTSGISIGETLKTFKSKKKLALKNNEVSGEKEYKKVFNDEIISNFKKLILSYK